MVWSSPADDALSFTISLSAYLEGWAIINHVTVTVNGNVFDWDSMGGWIPSAPIAMENNGISVVATIQNSVAAGAQEPDLLAGEFVSAQVTPSEATLQDSGIDVPLDGTFNCTWTFTMPPTNVGITINAYHWIEALP